MPEWSCSLQATWVQGIQLIVDNLMTSEATSIAREW
jgi:hypothetical protein